MIMVNDCRNRTVILHKHVGDIIMVTFSCVLKPADVPELLSHIQVTFWHFKAKIKVKTVKIGQNFFSV